MATAIEDRIRQNVIQNERLLKILSETDYVVSALQQNNSYIATLKMQIAEQEKTLQQVTLKRTKEYKDHQKYRDSHMRKFAYRLTGKKDQFDTKATTEEREWLDAVQLELQTKNALEQLKVELEDAQVTNAELQSVSSRKEQAQVDLDNMYNSIFEGPTTSIPAEDEKEFAVTKAESDFNEVQLQLSTEKQAHGLLLEAEKFLTMARRDIQNALSSNMADMWGGGVWAQMSEQNALGRAQQNVGSVEMLMNQAQRLHPDVQHPGGAMIARFDFWSNVAFDNIFSEMDLRQRIRNSEMQLESVRTNLQGEIRSANERIAKKQAEANAAKQVVNGKRVELQKVRENVFDSVVRGLPVATVGGVASAPDGAPPSYY